MTQTLIGGHLVGNIVVVASDGSKETFNTGGAKRLWALCQDGIAADADFCYTLVGILKQGTRR